MTINYRPNYNEPTALWKEAVRFKLQVLPTYPEMLAEIYPVHVPIVDMPQEIIDEMAPEDQHKALNVRIGNRAVVLCLN